MKGYNILNRPGRKKTLFSFCLVFLMAIAFFYINNARMDDFTSLITDASLQYQVEGVMKDYTTDVKLEDNTPLTFTIKATVPQGTLASTQQITYNLPQHLQVEDVQSNKLYLEDDLIHSIGSYEIKNNLLTMYFNDMNTESDLNIALLLETDSSHIVFDTMGTSTLSFNNKSIEVNKYFEQTTITTQIDEQIVADVQNNTNVEVSTLTSTPVTVSNDTTEDPRCGTATDNMK